MDPAQLLNITSCLLFRSLSFFIYTGVRRCSRWTLTVVFNQAWRAHGCSYWPLVHHLSYTRHIPHNGYLPDNKSRTHDRAAGKENQKHDERRRRRRRRRKQFARAWKTSCCWIGQVHFHSDEAIQFHCWCTHAANVHFARCSFSIPFLHNLWLYLTRIGESKEVADSGSVAALVVQIELDVGNCVCMACRRHVREM